MIRVRVLGGLEVELDGAPVALPSSAKARALVAWLALHPGMRPRSTLAARLWPDVLDSSARASLRSAVWALRRAFGDGRLLVASRDQIGLGDPDGVWVDLLEYERLARSGRPEEALALDSGEELLAGIDEEWVYAARDEHRERRMATLADAAGVAEARGDLAAAIAHDRQRTQLDPLCEPAHRDLIRRLGAVGDRGAALAAYARLRDRMRRDLALSPSPETRATVDALRGGEAVVEPSAAAAVPGEPAHSTVVTDRVRALPPLAGRAAERATLLDAWARAATGAGGAVLIEGEGGIGKTRLALELLAHAERDGAAVAACAALELGGAAPFGLWAELLGELARSVGPAVPDESAAWPEDVGVLSPSVAQRLRGTAARAPSASPEFERARLFEAVAEMVAWTASRRPLALLMEDVHSADAASLELAAYVARRLPDLPALLLITRRDAPRRPEADALHQALARRGALHAEIELGPLADDDVAALVRSVAPRAGDDEVERLVAASEGNALLAVETARATGEPPGAAAAGAPAAAPPPGPGVTAAGAPSQRQGSAAAPPPGLGATAASAPSQRRDSAAAPPPGPAATAGGATPARPRATAGGAPPPRLRALVRAATARLAPDARAVAELAAVAGRDLTREELLRLPVDRPAAAASAALESGLLAARDGGLGFRHALLRAAAYDDLPEPRRADLHDRLATALQAAGDVSAAELGRHLRLAGRDKDAVDQLARAGIDALRVGALAEATAFLDEALEIRPGDPDLLLDLGEVMAWRRDWDAADATFEQAVERLAPEDAAGRARAYARRGFWLRSSLCAPQRSVAAYRDALALLESLDAPPRDALLDVITGLAWSEGAGGDVDECDRLLRGVHELTRGRLDPLLQATVNFARGIALCRRGRFGECYGPLTAAADAFLRAGQPDGACGTLSNASCAAAFEHDFERALEYADRALRLGGSSLGITQHAQAARAYVLGRIGRHAEALAAAEAQCELAERSGSAELLATARHDLGEIALAGGDYATAERCLAEALDAGAAVPRALARLTRADALVHLGRADEAAAELRAATLEPLGPSDFPATLVPRLARVQGLVAAARGDRAGAETYLREAADGWRRQLDAGERGTYWLDLGRPPVAGLVEPDRELEQIERELVSLDKVPA